MTAILSTLAVFPSIDALNLRLSRGIGLTIIQGEGKGSNKKLVKYITILGKFEQFFHF